MWKSIGHTQFDEPCLGGESIQHNITCVQIATPSTGSRQ